MPDTEPDTVTATFAAIEKLARDTADLAVMLSPDVDGMVQLLVAIRRAAAQLRWAEDQLQAEIVNVMPSKDVAVPGVGQVTMRTATSRKQWDREGLTAAVVARIADEPSVFVDADTGEFLPPHRVAERVVAEFLTVGTPSWKTTGLRAMKLDPDEWCETTYGAKSIQTPTIDVTDLFSKASD